MTDGARPSKLRDRIDKMFWGEISIEEVLRLAREDVEEERRDIARLDWLQARGAIKVRLYDGAKHFWITWIGKTLTGARPGTTLREEIDWQMEQDKEDKL